MDVTVLIPALAMMTLLAVAIFALVSKKKVEKKLHDPNAKKSTLADDAPDTFEERDRQQSN